MRLVRMLFSYAIALGDIYGGFKKTAEEDLCAPPSNFDRVLPVLDLHVFVYYYTMTLSRCPPTMGGFKKTAEEDVCAPASNLTGLCLCRICSGGGCGFWDVGALLECCLRILIHMVIYDSG